MLSKHQKAMAAYAKRRNTAVALYAKGKTQQDIATKMGVTRQAVSAWLKREVRKAGDV